jgi:tellurite resistance protein
MGLLNTMLGGAHKVQGVGRTNKAQESLSPAEAFAAIAIAAVAADGYLSEEEIEGMSSMLGRMHLFKAYPQDVINRMFDWLLEILNRDGIGALFAIAQSSLPPELSETAFAVAADLILADGMVTEEEQEFLNQLCAALNIPSDLAVKIVEVMMIKNRG